LTDKVLGRYKWRVALVYIDDIIVYSNNFEDHVKDVSTVLGLVAKSDIRLSPKKCHIAYQSIKALGHTVSNLGIGTLEETVRSVKEYPTPHNVKSLQRFLGLAVYYRRFVKDFARQASPLYKLLEKDAPYKWTSEQEDSMNALKDALTSAPVLAHPNYEKPFRVYTDTSGQVSELFSLNTMTRRGNILSSTCPERSHRRNRTTPPPRWNASLSSGHSRNYILILMAASLLS
jgi:hypothetical protein